MAPPETRHLTFLFADIEGSTRLMERHGADAGAALSRYHELVALAASRHGGKLFERIGDGAYACFDAATDAVAAADAVQRAIIEHDWGVIGRMRVRISVVTGDVEAQGDRYYGRPLYRAARLQGLATAARRSFPAARSTSSRARCLRERCSATSVRSACATSRSPNGSSRWCILRALDPTLRRSLMHPRMGRGWRS